MNVVGLLHGAAVQFVHLGILMHTVTARKVVCPDMRLSAQYWVHYLVPRSGLRALRPLLYQY